MAGSVTTGRQDARVALHAIACLVILLAALAWAFLRGQDVNWDLQNYHQYDPYVLLHWRFASDVAPAGPQGFLNPLPYLLPYGLHRLLPPLPADLLDAAAQSSCLMIAWFMAWRLSRRPLTAVAATATAITGSVVLSELGTSFADLILATPPLAALLLLTASRSTMRLLVAGGLTGIAIGIKPTSLFLLPALAAFAAIQEDRTSTALRSAMLSVIGAIAGGLLSDGAWAMFLWRSYGSPVFPFMNTLFRSHSAALVDFADPRFHFTGVRHAFTIPFAIAAGSAVAGELWVRDARIASAACLASVFIAYRLIQHIRVPKLLLGLSAYVLLGLAGWLVLCPIERYAVVLEILSGLLCVLVVSLLPGRALASTAVFAASALLIVSTRPADYFHRSWSEAYRPVVPASIPRGAVYGLLTPPLAYWVTTPPRPVQAFGLTSTLLETGGVLQRRLDRLLLSRPDTLWLLNLDEPVIPMVREEMHIHRIALAPPCLRAASMIWIDTVFCRGMLTGSRTLAASDLAINQTVRFSTSGFGLIYEINGFGPAEPDGTWSGGHDATLAIHLNPATRAAGAVLSIRLAGVAGAPTHTVLIAADNARPEMAALAPPSYFATRLLCIVPAPGGDGTVLIRFHTDETRSAAQLGLGLEPRPLAFKLLDIALHTMSPTSCGDAMHR